MVSLKEILTAAITYDETEEDGEVTDKMTDKTKLPIGIENFDELRRNDFYYVDKTGLISELLEDWSKVNLFTRPRRFGKTLNMSMLRYFFETGTDKSIFDGLKVSENKEICDKYMGKYPVVFVTLKGVEGRIFESAYEKLKNLIRDEALRLNVISESTRISDAEKSSYMRIINEKDTALDITGSLRMLCNLLEKHYGQKVVLLIDEYDVPLDKAYYNGFYDQMIDIIRSMFNAALKTNDSLFLAVMTGCMRVSKESIFTGLNNLKVHSISDDKFDEYFGFTDDEVQAMLKNYGLESHYPETKAWYDGYRFGGQDIYCPWDVINYCYDLRASDRTKPKAYWTNTSGNSLIRRLIDRYGDGTTQFEIESLIAGETIVKDLNENLTHNEIDDNIDNLWSLLYMTGYLTAEDYLDNGQYVLRIPNYEVRKIFKEQVLEWFKAKTKAETGKLTALYTAFEEGDAETITEILNAQLLDTISYYDSYESFYRGFLLALLGTCADWAVASNPEAGRGRSDIAGWRRDRKIGFVVEVKNVKEEEELDKACKAAMEQIEDRDYTAFLRRYRIKEIWQYAIAFWDKECRVAVKKLC